MSSSSNKPTTPPSISDEQLQELITRAHALPAELKSKIFGHVPIEMWLAASEADKKKKRPASQQRVSKLAKILMQWKKAEPTKPHEKQQAHEEDKVSFQHRDVMDWGSSTATETYQTTPNELQKIHRLVTKSSFAPYLPSNLLIVPNSEKPTGHRSLATVLKNIIRGAGRLLRGGAQIPYCPSNVTVDLSQDIAENGALVESAHRLRPSHLILDCTTSCLTPSQFSDRLRKVIGTSFPPLNGTDDTPGPKQHREITIILPQAPSGYNEMSITPLFGPGAIHKWCKTVNLVLHPRAPDAGPRTREDQLTSIGRFVRDFACWSKEMIMTSRLDDTKQTFCLIGTEDHFPSLSKQELQQALSRKFGVIRSKDRQPKPRVSLMTRSEWGAKQAERSAHQEKQWQKMKALIRDKPTVPDSDGQPTSASASSSNKEIGR